MDEIKQKVQDLELALNYVCYDADLIPKLQTVWQKLELLQEVVNKCNIPLVSGSLQDIQEIIEFLQWAFRKVDKGDTPEETVRMLLMNREKIDNIKFDGNDR